MYPYYGNNSQNWIRLSTDITRVKNDGRICTIHRRLIRNGVYYKTKRVAWAKSLYPDIQEGTSSNRQNNINDDVVSALHIDFFTAALIQITEIVPMSTVRYEIGIELRFV